MLAAGKAKYIEKLWKGGTIVGMGGDGVNNMPALAAADVGMEIGTADFVLMRNNLQDVITAIDLSRKTVVRIQ